MSTPDPLISVIICFYNEKNFLEESIQSVLEQSYRSWELILVDDGSTDGSSDIAKKYSRKHPQSIRYVEHEGHKNIGLSASRNKGLEIARGELIAFLDADDVYLPEFLENQVSLFEDTSAAMICEATEYWYSWNSHYIDEDEIIPVGVKQNKLYKPRELNMLLYPLNGLNAAPCMCGIIIQKDKLASYGGFEESFTGMYEDQVFLAKIYFNEPVFISSTCNNRYRQRPGSLMSTAKRKEDYMKIRVRFLDWFKSYLKENNGKDTEVYKRVNKLLLPHKYPRIYRYFYYLPQKFINKFRKKNRLLT
jgi:glycosyltransferase involved in cell wall biosynthesis